MLIQRNARSAILAALFIAAALPARAEDWQEYAYADAGFSAHFPAKPVVTDIQFGAGALAGPAKAYAVQQGGASYSVVVADLSSSALGQDAAIEEAAKALATEGEVKLDVRARIDRQFGRELSVKGRGGEQVTTAVFYVSRKLYVLVGRTQPDASGLAVRFQQSLQFIDADGRPPRRPEDGPGVGPPFDGPDRGGERGRRRPPPEAFADCRGKSEGEAVQHRTPRGDLVAAVCLPTPEGLAARPDRRPGAAPDASPPEG